MSRTLDDEHVQELNSLRQAAVSCAAASCSCANPLLLIGIAALLVIIPGVQLLLSFRKSRASARQLVRLRLNSPLQFAGVVFNGCMGLVYLGLGLWMVAVDNIHQDASAYLPHWWLVALLQGFSLILTGFAFGVRPCFLGVAFVRFWSVFLAVCAAFIFYSSIAHIDVADKAITMKACFDVLFC
jgi:ATP-binding cassette, subfamily C (CFTR/MRP), member 2